MNLFKLRIDNDNVIHSCRYYKSLCYFKKIHLDFQFFTF
jgi:hypothetical protein